MLQSREPVSATQAMREGEVQVCSPSGRGVSLISESRRDIWVSGIPVKSGGALLVRHLPIIETAETSSQNHLQEVH